MKVSKKVSVRRKVAATKRVLRDIKTYASLSPAAKHRIRAGYGLASPTVVAGHMARQARSSPPRYFSPRSPATTIRSARNNPFGARRRNYGASNSKSVGFFKKGTSNKQALDYYCRAGVVMAYEQGGVVSGENTTAVAVGHCLYTYENIKYLIGVSICKFFAAQMDLQFSDIADVIYFGANAGLTCGVLKINWTPSLTATPNQNSFSILDTTTWNTLAAWVVSVIESTYTKQATLLSLEYDYDLTTTGEESTFRGQRIWDLTKATCDIYAKSSLKLQNRTVNSAGNIEADDVDNVPLYGKSYYGRGNYLGYFTNTYDGSIYSPMRYICEDVSSSTTKRSGIIQTALLPPLTEPPVKSTLRNVISVGKAHLDPGEIKTDVLVKKMKITINSLLSLIFGSKEAANEDVLHRLGSYKIFMLEKMIQAVATTATNAVKVAYEVDLKQGMVFRAPRTFTTNYIVNHNPL